MVRGQVLDMRVHVLGQYCAADIRHEQIFRRRVRHVRSPGDRHVLGAPGRPIRPHGLHIPKGDQVHVPQVRSVGHRRETRFTVPAAAEHRQREDLHIHMVLVRAAVALAGLDGRPQVRRTNNISSVCLCFIISIANIQFSCT